jgi:hypothetical protein
LGHYETPCGGCDTLKKLDDVYALYQKIMDNGEADCVIAEGKILVDDTKRIKLLTKKVILHFTTSIADCYAGVQARRWARGDHDKAFQKPKKLEADHRTINSAVNRLEAVGVKVVKVRRETATTVMLMEGLGYGVDHSN